MNGFAKIVIVLSLSLSGCSALGGLAAKAALGGVTGGSDGLSVDANVGQAKSEGDQGVTQNAATAVTAQVNDTVEETFQGDVGKVIHEAGLGSSLSSVASSCSINLSRYHRHFRRSSKPFLYGQRQRYLNAFIQR